MDFRVEPLGRMAVFLIPSLKLENITNADITVREKIEKFLIEHYAGFTLTAGNISGRWKDENGKLYYGEHRQYTVSFVGKGRIPELQEFLAEIADVINEKCIYLETGEDSWLVYPDKTQKTE